MTKETMRRIVCMTLLLGQLLLLLGAPQARAFARGFEMIDEPADAVSRRFVAERFYTESLNISDLRMSRVDELYLVFVKGGNYNYCEGQACLTVVFDPDDPGRVASFLSNGQFFISDAMSGRLGLGGAIIFSPGEPGELTVMIMPKSLILLGKDPRDPR